MSFSNILTNLKTCNQQVSTAFHFVCMLHLASEHNLELENMDGSDFLIRNSLQQN